MQRIGLVRLPNRLVRFSYDDHSTSTNILLSALPYKWTQELGEVDVVVPLPKGTRARDLNVVIQKKKLSVGFKGKENILEGELCKEIKVDDSTWNLGTMATSVYTSY
jgi:hypothetical protein